MRDSRDLELDVLEAASCGDHPTFATKLQELLSKQGAECLKNLRRREVLVACRNEAKRAAIRRAYVDTLLQANVAADVIRQETIYTAYSEVVGELRDHIAHRVASTLAAHAHVHPETMLEACLAVLRSRSDRTVRRMLLEHSEVEATPHETTSTLYTLSQYLGSVSQLADLIANDLLSRRRSVAPSGTQRCLIRGANELIDAATEWQRLSFIRQRVSFGIARVERVEPGNHHANIHLSPSSLERAWRQLATDRRLTLSGQTHRKNAHQLAQHIPVDTIKLSLDVVRHMGLEIRPHLLVQIAKDILYSVRPIDIILIDKAPPAVSELTRALWATHLIAKTINYALAENHCALIPAHSRRMLVRLTKADIVRTVGECAAVSEATSHLALKHLTSSIGGKTPIDTATRPFLPCEGGTLLVVRRPLAKVDLFMETRRVLATQNATSSFLGHAFEEHLRWLVASAGLLVAPGSLTLRYQGQAVTDVDVVAYKDGILFIMQAKCLPEPDSEHSQWKAQAHVDHAIHQSLRSRACLQVDPSPAASALGVHPSDIREICCSVVTPCLRFTGDIVWPVSVVDDMYLDHVLLVGETKTADANGAPSTRRLYPGDHPTGPELRALLLNPLSLQTLRSGTGGLHPVQWAIGPVTITDFTAYDDAG